MDDQPRNPSTIYQRMQTTLERAGCKKVRFYDLRHTFATMAIANGMDVKTLSATIGHVSATTTLDIYSHRTAEMEVRIAENLKRGIGKCEPSTARHRRKLPRSRQKDQANRSPLTKARSVNPAAGAFIKT
ncbi:MAG: hypothetical protein E7658_09195 [Ruminococcaceae bacterium]|nr:hypothetical protein [Oscillospiraceae bacterium]